MKLAKIEAKIKIKQPIRRKEVTRNVRSSKCSYRRNGWWLPGDMPSVAPNNWSSGSDWRPNLELQEFNL